MSYVILNGMYEEDTFIPKLERYISAEFKKQNISGETIDLYKVDIKACLGCFKCWVQTPGICIIDDESRQIVKKMVQSEYLVYLSPINYGGYSAELKKLIDRSIGMISPFFQVYHEEIHHEKRYEKYPNLLVFGTLKASDKEQEEIFIKLVQRNTLNNFAPEHRVSIIYHSDGEEKIKEKIKNSLEIVGEEND